MSDANSPPPIIISSPSASFGTVRINAGGYIATKVATTVQIASLVKA
jgi:hypothetical protein